MTNRARIFPFSPRSRFRDRSCVPVRRPREFACFSYDEQRQLHLDDSQLRYYYPPQDVGRVNLSGGFSSFVQLKDRRKGDAGDDQDKPADEGDDEHLDSLLTTLADWEQRNGKRSPAQVVTWRGMMTKLVVALYDTRDDGFEMNITKFQDTLFLEEHYAFRVAQQARQDERQRAQARRNRQQQPPELMQYWGYKLETLATLPRPWGEVTRDEIEGRDREVVNNTAQYCSLVHTGLGRRLRLCLAGEVDAVWDAKPKAQPTAAGGASSSRPIEWVEIKTSRTLRRGHVGDERAWERKLYRIWAQSFLLGVPRVVVGFRSEAGVLESIDESLRTEEIPDMVSARRRARAYREQRPERFPQAIDEWDATASLNFAADLLEWLYDAIPNESGVWRLRRIDLATEAATDGDTATFATTTNATNTTGPPVSPPDLDNLAIALEQVEESGHGRILTESFLQWRHELAAKEAEAAVKAEEEVSK